MIGPGVSSWSPWLAALAALAPGCVSERDVPAGRQVHPDGWASPASDDFHGTWLDDRGDPLAECVRCHGTDYQGGEVSVGCQTTSCHTRGVEFCGTCHGDQSGPRPDSGAHAQHAAADSGCELCHPLPGSTQEPAHIDRVVEVIFTGTARLGGRTPSWNPDQRTCAGTYCHGAESPPWDQAGAGGCDSCHGAPPPSHARFARVATLDRCGDCHPRSSHLDGVVQVTVDRCDACHGEGAAGMPPPALDGSSQQSDPGVGAHRAHAVGLIAQPVPCTSCHPVPAAVSSPGHIDASAPADVTLPDGGSYQAGSHTCQVWCHFDRAPGPVWTDASGAWRECDACHGFPPGSTRTGAPHPPSAPTAAACRGCHPFTLATHVDGEVETR